MRRQAGAAPSVATDAATKGYVDGIPAGHVGPFPMFTGRWYSSHEVLPAFNSDANVFGTSGTRGWLFPMYFAEATPIDRLGQSIVAAGNGNLILGIYDFVASMGAANRLVHATTDASVTGDKQLTVSATISAGFKLGFCGTTDTTGTLRVRRGSGPENAVFPWGSGAGWEFESFFGARYDALSLGSGAPATITLSSFATLARTDVPLAWVRRG